MTLDLFLLQGLGVVTGVAGTVAVTSPARVTRYWAFTLWIISNLALMAWSMIAGELLLLILYYVYLVISIVGLARTCLWPEWTMRNCAKNQEVK